MIKGIIIEVGGDEITISHEDAKTLYDDLKELFGQNDLAAPDPCHPINGPSIGDGVAPYEITCP
jgi:hypothetical protein